MSKQKFQIGDKVYVNRGNKNEIGRIGKITQIRKYSGRLGYIVKYNDDKFPRSGVFYADMLRLISDMQSSANYMAKEGTEQATKCKYCGEEFDDDLTIESTDELGVCEWCAKHRKKMPKIHMRKSIAVDLKDFSIYGKDGDWLEVTEWTNGEGIDIDIHYNSDHEEDLRKFQLSYDEFGIIMNIVNKFGYLPTIFTDKEETEN